MNCPKCRYSGEFISYIKTACGIAMNSNILSDIDINPISDVVNNIDPYDLSINDFCICPKCDFEETIDFFLRFSDENKIGIVEDYNDMPEETYDFILNRFYMTDTYFSLNKPCRWDAEIEFFVYDESHSCRVTYHIDDNHVTTYVSLIELFKDYKK